MILAEIEARRDGPERSAAGQRGRTKADTRPLDIGVCLFASFLFLPLCFSTRGSCDAGGAQRMAQGKQGAGSEKNSHNCEFRKN